MDFSLGTPPSYGVTLSGTTFSGYAWGNSVVGWLSFYGTSPSYGVQLSGTASLDAQNPQGSSIVGQTIPWNTSVYLPYTLTNLPGGTTCTLSKTSSGGTPFTDCFRHYIFRWNMDISSHYGKLYIQFQLLIRWLQCRRFSERFVYRRSSASRIYSRRKRYD